MAFKQVAVYCGSSPGKDPCFLEAAAGLYDRKWLGTSADTHRLNVCHYEIYQTVNHG